MTNPLFQDLVKSDKQFNLIPYEHESQYKLRFQVSCANKRKFMPVTWRKKENNFSIVVWKSNEPLSVLLQYAALSRNETLEWNSFKSESRKREWLTVRSALQILIPGANGSSIYYDLNGKPQLLTEGFISISHSQEYIAVLKANVSEIGVDIESIHPRIVTLSQKFLSDDEKLAVSDENKIEKLHVIWGAKEVLYKIHSIGEIDFKKDLFVHPFDYHMNGELKASILKKGFKQDYKISYEKADQYMLTWAIG